MYLSFVFLNSAPLSYRYTYEFHNLRHLESILFQNLLPSGRAVMEKRTICLFAES